MSEKSRAVAVSSRRFIGVAGILLLTIAVVVFLVQASFEGTSVRSNALSPQPMNAFSGGTFEASGVVQVPGTEAVLFVDDGRTNEIFWMRLGEDRKQSGAIKTIDIGTSIIDLEGITTDGVYFYVVGSQSKAKGGDLVGLARFKFDAANQRVTSTETAAGLKKFLADNVIELRGMGIGAGTMPRPAGASSIRFTAA